MTFRFLSPAQRDLAEAVQYYERAAPGLGLEFLDEIEKTVERILQHPEAWTRVTPTTTPGAVVFPRREAVRAALDAIESSGGCLIVKANEKSKYEAAIRALA